MNFSYMFAVLTIMFAIVSLGEREDWPLWCAGIAAICMVVAKLLEDGGHVRRSR